VEQLIHAMVAAMNSIGAITVMFQVIGATRAPTTDNGPAATVGLAAAPFANKDSPTVIPPWELI